MNLNNLLFTGALLLLPYPTVGAQTPAFSLPITLSGSINETQAAVVVNGIAATITGNTFIASDVLLQFGANTLVVAATDLAGNTAQAQLTLYLDLPDNLKTYYSTQTISGNVDDSSSTVEVNAIAATLAGNTFSAAVDLNYGSNSLTATATDLAGNAQSTSILVFVSAPESPNTAPSIQSIIPATPQFAPAGTSLPLMVNATDADGDALEYRALFNNAVVVDWQNNASFSWTPTESQFGRDMLAIEIRDPAGGTDSSDVDVFVVRTPITP